MSVLRATWQDLVRRRLLPVAVVLLGALVAVPVLLAKEPAPVPAPAPAPPARGVTTALAQPVVALDEQEPPPARRRVLGARKDPFQPAPLPEARKSRTSRGSRTASPSAGSTTSGPGTSGATGSDVSTGGGTSALVPVSPVVTPPTAVPTPGGGDQPADEPDDGQDEAATPDDAILIRFGDAAAESLETRTLERLAPLPDADAPFAAYLGLDEHGAAVFLLDAGITAEGDGTCRPAPQSCATFTLREDETEFLHVPGEDGAEGAVYELDVVDIPRGAKGTAAAAAARVAAKGAAPVGASAEEDGPVEAAGEEDGPVEAAGEEDGPVAAAAEEEAPAAASAREATRHAPVREVRTVRALVRERTASLGLRYAYDRRTRTVTLERPRSWRDALRRVLLSL